MCIPFNGTDYYHGLSVTKQMETGLRYFDVLVTKHTEDQPYRYSGICLNNGYQVCTAEYAKSAALFELLEKIVSDTLASEKEYAIRYPDEPFIPLVNVQEKYPDVYNDFSEKMKDARSLDEYSDLHKDLKPFLEKPLFNSNSGEYKPIELGNRLKDMITTVPLVRQLEAIYDCKDMYLTSRYAKSNVTLNDCDIKYARV